jgi:flagellar biosynthesis/type III secretory pathway ATPase
MGLWSSLPRSGIVMSGILDGHFFLQKKLKNNNAGPAAGDNRIGKNIKNHKLNSAKFRAISVPFWD